MKSAPTPPEEMTTVQLLRSAAGSFEGLVPVLKMSQSDMDLFQRLISELYARATRLDAETGARNPIGRETARHINAPRRMS